MLDGRETRLAGEIITRELLLAQMRGMVGADGVNQAVVQSLEQSLLIAVRLDGRIALDGETLGLIFVVIEPQVMWTGFSSYLFVFQRDVILE